MARIQTAESHGQRGQMMCWVGVCWSDPAPAVIPAWVPKGTPLIYRYSLWVDLNFYGIHRISGTLTIKPGDFQPVSSVQADFPPSCTLSTGCPLCAASACLSQTAQPSCATHLLARQGGRPWKPQRRWSELPPQIRVGEACSPRRQE